MNSFDIRLYEFHVLAIDEIPAHELAVEELAVDELLLSYVGVNPTFSV